ncbi:MAG: MerR family transcriptional regulator [Gulosibacter sp.]|uniref:helix-turn-helix domain-containing protein n=1 Tax=Gulosibacter sp. TaxID=2817531 RepID=UPI003F93F189
MAWSTRELAELAGTTTNTVRHYHRLGLLDEPARRYNGYKQYGATHLVRLLRIRRLAELGVPLAQIAADGDGSETMAEALREVDAELALRIHRLEQARSDIATLLRNDAPADSPAGFESVAALMTETDSAFIHIYSRLYDQDALADLRRMIEMDATSESVGHELDSLADDADEETRERLAAQIAPSIAQSLTEYPWLAVPGEHVAQSAKVVQRTIMEAVLELYNEAQIDVIVRAVGLAQWRMQDEGAADAPEPGDEN